MNYEVVREVRRGHRGGPRLGANLSCDIVGKKCSVCGQVPIYDVGNGGWARSLMLTFDDMVWRI